MQAFSNFISMTPLPPKATFEKIFIDLFNKGNGIIPVNCTKIEYLSNRKKIESVKSVRTVLKSDCIDGKKSTVLTFSLY